MADNAWYSFYIGDYDRDTSHLSMLEHGAYLLLINHYYAMRQPIPSDLKILYRICRATNPPERRAVQEIVSKFFVLENGCYTNKRCDREIEKLLKFINRQSAAAQLRHKPRQSHGSPKPQPQLDSKKEIKQSSSEYVSPPVMTTIEDSDSEKVKPSPYHAVEFHERYNEVREYITLRLPALANKNATEANRWLLDGADPEVDIFPNVDFCIEAARGNISSFKYFTPSIISALKIKNERKEQQQRLRGKYAKPE